MLSGLDRVPITPHDARVFSTRSGRIGQPDRIRSDIVGIAPANFRLSCQPGAIRTQQMHDIATRQVGRGRDRHSGGRKIGVVCETYRCSK